MISTIHLWNFKCFEDNEVPLGPFTLLAGPNATGKSTVLQSLLLLRQSHAIGELAKGRLDLNGELVEIGRAQDALFEDADEDRLGIELIFDDSAAMRFEFSYDRTTDRLHALETVSDAFQPDVFHPDVLLFNNPFHYLSAYRLGPQTTLPLSEWRVREHYLGSLGEYVWHYLLEHGSEAVSSPNVTHPAAKKRTLLAHVEAWMGVISPGVHLELQSIGQADKVIAGYRFERPDSDVATRAYRPTNVGFGISYSLPVVVALVAAPPAGMVLIENPEAHLHPRGQTQLGRLAALAAAGGTQVLLETHSDHVLNGVRIAVRNGELSPTQVRLNYFERTGNRAAILFPQIDADGRIDHWPDGFFDEHERTLAELIA